MFERYTENARSVIYSARHQAGRLGSPSIGCAHLLLATLEQSGTMFFAAGLRGLAEFLTKDINRTLPAAGAPIPTHFDLRLSEDCVNALARAVAEADRLRCQYINVAHLTLGLMLASPELSGILKSHGVERSELERIAQQVERNILKSDSVRHRPSGSAR